MKSIMDFLEENELNNRATESFCSISFLYERELTVFVGLLLIKERYSRRALLDLNLIIRGERTCQVFRTQTLSRRVSEIAGCIE